MARALVRRPPIMMAKVRARGPGVKVAKLRREKPRVLYCRTRGAFTRLVATTPFPPWVAEDMIRAARPRNLLEDNPTSG